MSAKPAVYLLGCQRVGLPSRARGCLSGLGVASRPSQSRQPPAQALADLLTIRSRVGAPRCNLTNA
jgi:hypothetical protein